MEDMDIQWCQKMETIEKAAMDLSDGQGVRPLTEDEFDEYLWQQWTVISAVHSCHQLSVL